MQESQDKLSKLLRKYVKVNYVQTIYRVFHVLALSNSTDPADLQEARRILNSNIDSAARNYVKKVRGEGIQNIGPQTILLMNKSGKVLGLNVQRQAVFQGRRLCQVESRNKDKIVSKPIEFTKVLPIQSRNSVLSGSKRKKPSQNLQWVVNKQFKLRVIVVDQKQDSSKAIYSQTLELANKIKDKCLAILVQKKWNLNVVIFLRNIAKVHYEPRVAAQFIKGLRNLSQLHRRMFQQPLAGTFSQETGQRKLSIKQAESQQFLNKTLYSQIITKSKIKRENSLEDEREKPVHVNTQRSVPVQLDDHQQIYQDQDLLNFINGRSSKRIKQGLSKKGEISIGPREQFKQPQVNQSSQIKINENKGDSKAQGDLYLSQLSQIISPIKTPSSPLMQRQQFFKPQPEASVRFKQQNKQLPIQKNGSKMVMPLPLPSPTNNDTERQYRQLFNLNSAYRSQQTISIFPQRLFLPRNVSRMINQMVTLRVGFANQVDRSLAISMKLQRKDNQFAIFKLQDCQKLTLKIIPSLWLQIIYQVSATETLKFQPSLFVNAMDNGFVYFSTPGAVLQASSDSFQSQDLSKWLTTTEPQQPVKKDQTQPQTRILKQFSNLNCSLFIDLGKSQINEETLNFAGEFGLPVHQRTNILLRNSGAAVFQAIYQKINKKKCQGGLTNLLDMLMLKVQQQSKKKCNMATLINCLPQLNKLIASDNHIYLDCKHTLLNLAFINQLLQQRFIINPFLVSLVVVFNKFIYQLAKLWPSALLTIDLRSALLEWILIFQDSLFKSMISSQGISKTNDFFRCIVEDVLISPQTKAQILQIAIKTLLQNQSPALSSKACQFYEKFLIGFADDFPAIILINLYNHALLRNMQGQFFLLSLGLWLFTKKNLMTNTGIIFAQVRTIYDRYFSRQISLMGTLERFLLADSLKQTKDIFKTYNHNRNQAMVQVEAKKEQVIQLKLTPKDLLNIVDQYHASFSKRFQNDSTRSQRLQKMLLDRSLSFNSGQEQLHLIIHDVGKFKFGNFSLLVKYGNTNELTLVSHPHLYFKRKYNSLELQIQSQSKDQRYFVKIDLNKVRSNFILTELLPLTRLGGDHAPPHLILISLFRGDVSNLKIMSLQSYRQLCEQVIQLDFSTSIDSLFANHPGTYRKVLQRLKDLFTIKGNFNIIEFSMAVLTTLIHQNEFVKILYKLLCLFSMSAEPGGHQSYVLLKRFFQMIDLPMPPKAVDLLFPQGIQTGLESQTNQLFNMDGQEQLPDFSGFLGRFDNQLEQSRRLMAPPPQNQKFLQFCKSHYNQMSRANSGILPKLNLFKLTQLLGESFSLSTLKTNAFFYNRLRAGLKPYFQQFKGKLFTIKIKAEKEMIEVNGIAQQQQLTAVICGALRRPDKLFTVTLLQRPGLRLQTLGFKQIFGNLDSATLEVKDQALNYCQAACLKAGRLLWRTFRITNCLQSQQGRKLVTLADSDGFYQKPSQLVRNCGQLKFKRLEQSQEVLDENGAGQIFESNISVSRPSLEH